MKKLVILQSNYIPWKGYFDLMWNTDEFMILDDVQYTKNDWRNRNQIITESGKRWLTIPVNYRFSEKPLISEISISSVDWINEHLGTLYSAYKDSAFFYEFFPVLENWYTNCRNFSSLSTINLIFLNSLVAYLEIPVSITSSSTYLKSADLIKLDRNQRLIELCKLSNTTDYLTGPSAQDYLTPQAFENCKIKVHVADYSNYKCYPQNQNVFDHNVSILDLIFNVGKDALHYLKKENLFQSLDSQQDQPESST